MIAILAALKDEIKPILKETEILEKVHLRPAIIIRGEYQGKEIIIGHTGVGVDKMYRAAQFCIKEYRPEICINVGYCGALTPHLSLGDMIVADSVVYEKNGASLPQNSTMSSKKDIEGFKIHNGIILTVDKVISNPHEKAFLGTKFGAIAVDMESFGLALAAFDLNSSFGIVRSVLDPMDMHLPAFSGSVSDAGTTNVMGLVSDIIHHPKEAMNLPQLQFCASKARENLLRFINEVIL